MKETRFLSSGNLRALCIERHWYTRGDNVHYSNLLQYANNLINVLTEDIVFIAKDIKENSDTQYNVNEICFEVARICNSIFEG